MSENVSLKPDLKIRHFEGPLDLLFHLIEKNDIDIYDIPISEVTAQYMEHLDKMQKLDMEVASDFIVMAATLVHIKSRMLIPNNRFDDTTDEEDPREELVISLLRYKRAKFLAGELKTRHSEFSNCYYRVPSTAKSLDIEFEAPPQEFDPKMFDEAVDAVCKRNEIRFADISSKITHILKRDKLSVRERMKSVWNSITKRGKMFFHELFAGKKVDKIDRIVGFLAVLELLRSDKICAEQKKPFDVILLEEKRKGEA
ncbi:MAG: segregation/condensation protein A [Clostridia bacterium]|nr:segregation/condensation protein A [Clostridia bacterium]